MGLLDFFRKDKPSSAGASKLPVMADLGNSPLQEGDTVMSLRYDMGRCRVVGVGDGYEYVSETGKRVSWLRMVDAATQLQKVRKL